MLFIMSQLRLTLPPFYCTVSDFLPALLFFCLNNCHQFHFSSEIIIRLLLGTIFISRKRETISMRTKQICTKAVVHGRRNENRIDTKWKSNEASPITFNFNWIRLSLFPAKCNCFVERLGKPILIDGLYTCVPFIWMKNKTPWIQNENTQMTIFWFRILMFFSSFPGLIFPSVYLLSIECIFILLIFPIFFSISRWNRRSTAKQTVSITAMTI